MYYSLRHMLFFHILSSAICTHGYSEDSSSTQVNLTNVHMIPNGTVDVIEHQVKEFNCIVDDLSTPVIRWYINSTEVDQATNMTIENNTLISVYDYVGSRTDLDTTIYCEASNDKTTFRSNNATLNVIYGPEVEQGRTYELVGGYSVSGGIHVGWSLNLSCHGDCNPPCTYKWLKNGFYFSMSENLIFKSVKKEDDGTYVCFIRNVVTNIEYTREKRLKVASGPDEVELDPDIYVYTIPEFSQHPLVIRCRGIGCKPGCIFENWHKHDVLHGTYSYLYIGSVLLFNNITRSDAGHYSCYVANRVNSTYSHDVKVNVIYGPQNSVSISPPSTTVSQRVGYPLNPIRCSADCYPPCQYQWLKDSNIVMQDQTLSIDAIQKTDNGNYTCRAWNEAGEEFINITLTVNYGPENIIIVPDQTTYILTEYDSLPAIACYSDCQPTCSALWVGPNLNQRSHVLNITTINRTQTGDYSCLVNNSSGPIYSKKIKIMVEYSPEVISLQITKRKTVNSIEQKVTLTCNVDGVPKPRVVWSLNDTVLGYLENTTSHEVTAFCQSSEIYKCTAINHHGQESKEIDIVVFCNTKSYSMSSPLFSFSGGIGAGGGGVLIVVMIIFIINMKRKNKHPLHNKTGYKETHNRNRYRPRSASGSHIYEDLQHFSEKRM